ncbi:MAG TPA: NADH-quinone oxidoreductase subunit NuoH [Tepidisphaeraceae bacterium]|nr:NADH-quinone oxidoreductase subunit NuoH [Tepidisphaeraceae bacterium]
MLDWIFNIPPWVFIAVIAHLVITGTVAYLILLERKVASWTQDRLGPNRVGPAGLLQPIADGLKMFVKEDYRPRHVDKVLFTLAPAVMMITVIISIATIPWGGSVQRTTTVRIPPDATHVSRTAVIQAALPAGATVVSEVENRAPLMRYTGELETGHRVEVTYRWPFQIARLDIGVLFILAVLSLAVYGVVIGGWASNNKYSFLGGLRATAQMISYEIPLGLAVIAVVIMFGTLDLLTLVDRQATYWAGWVPAWNVFAQPIAFLLFLICIHAEANRAPFDLAEAEQELVGGYHTEYSSMRFGLFFLAEYAGMITTSAICVALFFGGWHLPYLDKIWPALSGVPNADGTIATANIGATESILIAIFRAVVLYAKTMVFIFIFMWVRWSLPRFRFDQLMALAWGGLIPISLAVMVVTAIVVFFFGGHREMIPLPTGQFAVGPVPGKMALWLLIANGLLLIGVAIAKKLIPPGPDTNRKVAIPGSRFTNTHLPAGVTPTTTTPTVENVPS